MPTDDWASLFQSHDDLADATVVTYHGVVVKHEGDGMFAAFESATDAIAAGAALSRAVAAHDWGGPTIRLRIGIHTGDGHRTRAGPTTSGSMSTTPRGRLPERRQIVVSDRPGHC
jgi:class 3 adenylate cyclase